MPPGSACLLPCQALLLYKATICHHHHHHLFKVETKTRLLMIATMAKILHQKSNTFEDKKLSAQLNLIYLDLNKMVADF